MVKFVKYQYRNSLNFYLIYTISSTAILLWIFLKYFPKDEIAPIFFIFSVISTIAILISHCIRFNELLTKPERFLVFSSNKITPGYFLLSEFLHFLLDIVIFILWFNGLGFLFNGSRYIEFVIKYFVLKDKVNFFLVLFYLNIIVIYCWIVGGIVFYHVYRRFTKVDYIVPVAVIVIVNLWSKLISFIDNNFKNIYLCFSTILIISFLTIILLMLFITKSLKKGLQT